MRDGRRSHARPASRIRPCSGEEIGPSDAQIQPLRCTNWCANQLGGDFDGCAGGQLRLAGAEAAARGGLHGPWLHPREGTLGGVGRGCLHAA
eukprot:1195937-Prorocentrum_minimum.AAC.3